MTKFSNNEDDYIDQKKLEELPNLLSAHLKSPGKYVFFEAHNTKPCVPVIHKPRQEKPLLTTKTTHFCVLFSSEKVPLAALEIFTYCTITKHSAEKLVYVSKADTTGLPGGSNVNVGGFATAYVKWICQMSIEYLLKNVYIRKPFIKGDRVVSENPKTKNIDTFFVSETGHRLSILRKRAAGETDCLIPASSQRIEASKLLNMVELAYNPLGGGSVRTKLVLFTRSEGQYLFPESMKNAGKHILEGRALLKWWLKNIDFMAAEWSDCEKYLNILNSEAQEIKRYFPSLHWRIGNVYENNKNATFPAIYEIPLLPDDPKGRFLEHLVVEGRAKKVKQRQYWQELAIRQEFTFGAVVGLIGISGFPRDQSYSKVQNNYGYVTSKCLRQFKDLVTTKDYSDSSDWNTLFDELLLLSDLQHYDIIGSWEGRQSTKRAAENITPVANTLMCVRSKKKSKS